MCICYDAVPALPGITTFLSPRPVSDSQCPTQPFFPHPPFTFYPPPLSLSNVSIFFNTLLPRLRLSPHSSHSLRSKIVKKQAWDSIPNLSQSPIPIADDGWIVLHLPTRVQEWSFRGTPLDTRGSVVHLRGQLAQSGGIGLTPEYERLPFCDYHDNSFRIYTRPVYTRVRAPSPPSFVPGKQAARADNMQQRPIQERIPVFLTTTHRRIPDPLFPGLLADLAESACVYRGYTSRGEKAAHAQSAVQRAGKVGSNLFSFFTTVAFFQYEKRL